jgi:ferredoxin-NADP reductase
VPAKQFTCKVISKKWLTPTVVELRFEPSKKFRYEAGQFVSVVVPPPFRAPTLSRDLRRAYSLATAPHEGYGLCVRVVPNGPGSNYIASLKEGDTLRLYAAYGDFLFDHRSPRSACFISTGTGIAPLLSMIRSKEFRDNPPPSAINLFGARSEKDIIYPGLFASLGLTEINAVSDAGPEYAGFRGRVTDYLISLPNEWPWQETDFYLCGSGAMVSDVRRYLRTVRGVPEAHIHQEIYFAGKPSNRVGDIKPVADAAAVPLKKTA